MTAERAVEIDRYGGPEELVWRPVSRRGPRCDEVRIRTAYAAVNRADIEIRGGTWPLAAADPFPYTPGLEVVGVVSSVGSAVSSVAVGDRVITMMQHLGGIWGERPGGYGEFVVVAADTVAVVPGDVELEQVAALGLVAVTAAEGLRRLGLKRGARVVVHGASGGVGSAAVAMAAARDCEVIAVLPRSTASRSPTPPAHTPRSKPASSPAARCCAREGVAGSPATHVAPAGGGRPVHGRKLLLQLNLAGRCSLAPRTRERYLRGVSEAPGFECSCCGDWHDEMPLAYHAAAPAPWSPEMAQEPGSVLGEEQCIIAGEQFFVRAIVRLAVLDAADEFEWGVWVALDEVSFMRMNTLWELDGRENEPAVRGWLSSDLPFYEPTTLALQTSVHTQPVGLRPLVELLDRQHPLAIEQREGIMLERVQQFAEQLIHG